MMNRRMTTLGLDERVERVLAYALFWVSGLILFFFEKNRAVRWHAAQSIVTFGILFLLIFAVNLLGGLLGWIPILGWIAGFGLAFLTRILWWTVAILWVWLMVMAWFQPNYRLPIVSNWVRYWVG